MFYPCSENKGADQLRDYCEADLRLCFRICRLLVFPSWHEAAHFFYYNFKFKPCHEELFIRVSNLYACFWPFEYLLEFVKFYRLETDLLSHEKTNNMHRRKPCTADDQHLCFHYTDSTIPFLLNPKCHDSNLLLWQYSPICVGPGRKPKLSVF